MESIIWNQVTRPVILNAAVITSISFCKANQCTGFYLIGTSVMKELSFQFFGFASNELSKD